MVRCAARAGSRPRTVTRRAGGLATELAGIAKGSRRSPRSGATSGSQTGHGLGTPCRGARCRPTWLSRILLRTCSPTLNWDWRDNTRLKFVLTNLIAASAPSNNPYLSPAARKAHIDTGGLSLVRGMRAFASDMTSSPHIPTMVKRDAFQVGKDLAVTPGSVVARTEVCELIQYQPATPTVHEFPLLMVPPMINKYYITDIAPGRSMIEYFVSQGYQVFVIVWRNPAGRPGAGT